MPLLDYIPTGKSEAIPAQKLADLAGCRSVRELQKHIERLRREGNAILSCSDGGYCMASEPWEVREFERTLRNRARNTLRTADAVRRAYDDMTGQGRIEGC